MRANVYAASDGRVLLGELVCAGDGGGGVVVTLCGVYTIVLQVERGN